MQSEEVISQDALRAELRQMIKDELKQDFQFLKVSPIRRVPPKDLSMDIAWIDGKLRLAWWIQIASIIPLVVFFLGVSSILFFFEDLPLVKAKSLISIIFFGTLTFAGLFYRWNKIESLLKILKRVNTDDDKTRSSSQG
jgi:hypothetical protein